MTQTLPVPSRAALCRLLVARLSGSEVGLDTIKPEVGALYDAYRMSTEQQRGQFGVLTDSIRKTVGDPPVKNPHYAANLAAYQTLVGGGANPVSQANLDALQVLIDNRAIRQWSEVPTTPR